MRNREISSEILLSQLRYNDGILYWKEWRRGRKRSLEAGTVNSKGYVKLTVDGVQIYAHRVVWIMHNGDIPPNMEVDHINHNRADNRIENLRLVTRLENNMNKSVQINNSSGVTGVTFCKQTGKWRAQIQINGKNVSLGRYESIHEAETARKTVQKDFSFHKNHGV